MKKTRAQIQHAYEKARQDAFIKTMKAIEKVLVRHKLIFSSVGIRGIDIKYNRTGEYVENTAILKKIDYWLQWYQDMFGVIGFFHFEDGKWFEGETRLIKFYKPYVK
jgi:hypothetical protein